MASQAASLKKFTNLQRQMQQNNIEISDFMRDLTNWSDDIENTDKTLSKDNLENSNNSGYYNAKPLRNRTKTKESKTTIKGRAHENRLSERDFCASTVRLKNFF